jgi:predicted MFS family arabinose efflux permease
LLLVLAVALGAYLLKLSVAILTSHWPRRFVLSLVLVNVVCSLLYVAAANVVSGRSVEPIAIGLFVIANEVVAAVLYAKELLPPQRANPE